MLVGNAFGDVLVLLNEGNGVFKPPTIVDQSVALAVTYASNGTPSFIYSDQSRDRVVEQTGSQAQAVVADRTNGLLVPGVPILADLGGDGIDDLIIANTGGNTVFVYPGLPGGGFGPALNDGNGFAVGTNPVTVIVAELNNREDLIVANKGSNDVSVLLNEPTENGSFTFVPGPRFSVGQGPVGLLYGDFFGNGTNELVVSNSGSNNLEVLPSLGNGFFNDVNPMIIPLDVSPGLIVAGSLRPGTGTDIVALDPESSEVTLISGLDTGSPTAEDFSSGGLDPVAGFVVPGTDDLVVANNADGRLSLLVGGPQGLTLEQVSSSPDLLNPTGLAFASISNDSLDVYAATAGAESAILLGFSLGGLGGPSANFGGQALTLLTSTDSTLPLIATLLTPLVNLNAPEGDVALPSEGNSPGMAQAPATTAGLGQGPFTRNLAVGPLEEEGELEIDPNEPAPAEGEKAALPLWRRIEMGLDEAFDALRRANQKKATAAGGPDQAEDAQSPPPGRSVGATAQAMTLP